MLNNEIKKQAFFKTHKECLEEIEIIKCLEKQDCGNLSELEILIDSALNRNFLEFDSAYKCLGKHRDKFQQYINLYAFDWEQHIVESVLRAEKDFACKIRSKFQFNTLLMSLNELSPSEQFYKVVNNKNEVKFHFKTTLKILSEHPDSFNNGIIRASLLLNREISDYCIEVLDGFTDCPIKIYPKIALLTCCLGDQSTSWLNETDLTVLKLLLEGLTIKEIQNSASKNLDQSVSSIQPGQIFQALEKLKLCKRAKSDRQLSAVFPDNVKRFLLSFL